MTNAGHPPSRQAYRLATPMMAIWFALFVFGILTFYATLNPAHGNPVVSDKRIFATIIGAFVYWFTIRAIAHRFGQPSRDILMATLLIGIPGSLLILAVRTLYDVATLSDLSGSFESNLRWVLLWLGYFGAWVAGFFAIACRRGAVAAHAAPCDARMPKTDVQGAAEATLMAVIDELADQPEIDRARLAAALIARSGYELADCMSGDTGTNDRIVLARAIAARLTAPGTSEICVSKTSFFEKPAGLA